MDKHELIEHLKEGHQNELDELSKLSKGELPTTNIKVGGVNVGVVNQGIQNLAKEQERKLLQDKNNLINSLKQAHLEPLCFFGDKQIERLKAANYYDLRSCDKDTGLIKLNVKQLLENEHMAGTGFHILIGFVGWIIIGFGIKSLYYEQVEPIAFFLGYALAYIVTLFCLVGLYTAIKIKQIENSVLFFMSPFAFISTYLDSLVKYGQRNIKKSVFVEKSNHSFLDQPEKTNLTSLDLEREKLVIVKAEYHVKEPAKIEKSIVQDALVSAYQNNLKVHTLADIDDFCIKLPESITTRQSVSTQTNKPVIQFVSNGNVYAAIAVYSGVEQVN